jgi:hypothetical protein
MIRHGRTGEVLAFARGGQVDLAAEPGPLEVTLSDGLLSHRFVVTG